MTDLPGYDAWKTRDPDEGRCEFCGIHERYCRDGWQPDCCTGVAWLRTIQQKWDGESSGYAHAFADAIERGEHLETKE